MSEAKVREYLKPFRLEDRVLSFDVSSATVEEAAKAVGCAPQRIAKTMSFLVDGKAVLVVMAGDAKVDNPKYKAAFRQKATMIPAGSVLELTGFPMGGVCPFAVPTGVPVYLDESLKRFDVVYPSGGSKQSAVKVSLGELETASGAVGWVDVGKVQE